MRPNRLLEMFARRECAINAWLALGSPYAAEVIANARYDSVTVDLQHGMFDFESALAQLQAISTTDAVPMVRIPANEPWMAQKMLDAGAYGIICPMISTASECERFIKACRYPPRGERSYGPARGLLYGGRDYIQHADSHVLTWAMIETREGVRRLSEILSVSGLDGIYVGPSDLALNLGHPIAPEIHEEIRGVAEDLRRAAQAAGKRTGIFCPTVAVGREMIASGFDLITVSNDTELLRGAASSTLDVLRARSVS